MRNPYDYILLKLCKIPELTSKLLTLGDEENLPTYVGFLRKLESQTTGLTKKIVRDIRIDLIRWTGIVKTTKPTIPHEIIGYKNGVPIRRIPPGYGYLNSMEKRNATKSCQQQEFEDDMEPYNPDVERLLYSNGTGEEPKE